MPFSADNSRVMEILDAFEARTAKETRNGATPSAELENDVLGMTGAILLAELVYKWITDGIPAAEIQSRANGVGLFFNKMRPDYLDNSGFRTYLPMILRELNEI